MSPKRRSRTRPRTVPDGELTAFGRWIRDQPRGAQSKAMMATGLAYTTVLAAKTRRVTKDVAEALAEFTCGEVSIEDLVKARPHGRTASRAA